MDMKTAFLYTDAYFHYGYGQSHPLKIERLRVTYDLCIAYGLFDLEETQLIETRPAPESEILRFHSNAYVDVLKQVNSGQSGDYSSYGLGPGDNPLFPGVWEWSRLHTGASLQCADMVVQGTAGIAFNIAGGLHHAGPDHASGFCYINDPVLAILHLLDKGKRVLYLDIDAHHGDGVQWAFYEEPRVLTVSFHQDGRTLFPGTGGVTEIGKGPGEGYSVNVPMLPGTDDRVFWEGFCRVLPRLLEQFRPDVVVSQLGVDSFWSDPLASLELTTNGFSRVIFYLTGLETPWVALGGGGYNIFKVARAWTLAWAIMNRREIPEDIPEEFWSKMPLAKEPRMKLRDPEHEGSRQEQCGQFMNERLEYLERHVFPRIGCP